jgi:DNA-binding transcriptional MocR family regulator
MDREGVRPEAVLEAQRSAPLRAIYVQPTLHNPLGVTMGSARRAEIAAILTRSDLYVIEDAVYSFLADEVPMAALAPDRVLLIDSLSKRIAPGLTLGMAACPSGLTSRVAAAIRSGAWAASGYPLAVGVQWMANGTASRLVAAKRVDASDRHAIALQRLSGMRVVSDPRAYHLWLELPEHWRAETFAASASRHGIAVTPGRRSPSRQGTHQTALRRRSRARLWTSSPLRSRRCETSRRATTLTQSSNGEGGSPGPESAARDGIPADCGRPWP